MKIFNFRPIVFIAVFLIVGIISSTYYFAGVLSLPWFIVLLGITFLMLIIGLILMFASKSNYNKFKFGKRVLICVIAFIVGVCVVSMANSTYKNNKIVAETYNVTGRVCAVPVYYENNDTGTILLDDVVIELGNRVYTLGGKTKVFVSSGQVVEDLNIGNVLEFKARVKSFHINDETEINRNFYNLANDIYYSASVKSDIIVLDEVKVSIFESFKLKAKDIMDTKFDANISAIGYGMMFGEDEYIDEKISDTYNNAGISHLLAVSGLHIGFIVLLLSSIFGLCKIKERTSSIILIIVLFLYVIICGFATSVVRAFIMTTCMLLSRLFKKSYDSLSALGLAAILILVISPLDLFTAGFQLSFMAVLGIILLGSVFNKFFSKFLFEQFASSLSLSLSASLGIMPIMMVSFQKFSIVSVFTNMIVVPVASIGFMLLFLGIILVMIVPILSIIIVPFDAIMRFVTVIASVASNLSINMLEINTSSAVIFLCLGGYAIFSEYIRLKPTLKIIFVLLLIVVAILIML